MDNAPTHKRVVLGRISGLFGVHGWVKVYSYTVPPANILAYDCWQLHSAAGWQYMRVVAGRKQGKALVAQLGPVEGDPISDRGVAAVFLNAEIAVARSAMPEPAPGRFYWADLVGLRVYNLQGQAFGCVDSLLETGANGVLVVSGERERLIPFVYGPIVTAVDLASGVLTVDWDPDF